MSLSEGRLGSVDTTRFKLFPTNASAMEENALPAPGSLEEAFPSLKGANESGPVAPAPASGAGESNDTRDRRIANGKLYSGGVASWRTRVVASTGPAEEHSSTARARVFVRVRPLFEHEAERGEWECVSTGESAKCTCTCDMCMCMLHVARGPLSLPCWRKLSLA